MAESSNFDWNKYLCCWSDLLDAQACCIYNVIFSPFVLLWHSTRIYFCGCLCVYLKRLWLMVCCFLCRTCDCCWMYTDKEFPPNETSLGEVKGDTANSSSGKNKSATIWVRASEFSQCGGRPQNTNYDALEEKKSKKSPPAEGMKLFQDEITPEDICQGSLGDCWLLAAFSCLSIHYGAIQSRFITKEYDPRGKYKVKLFDVQEEKWKTLVVDDYIPVDADSWNNHKVAKPKYTQPNGNELWTMILEKAFAKLCGSYANLEGGTAVWALRAMTGDYARVFKLEGESWRRWNLQSINAKESRCEPGAKGIPDKRAAGLVRTDETCTKDDFWELLEKYAKLKSVLTCNGAQNIQGLHSGHAYAILNVKKEDGNRLINIRNPWGSGEWTGDWGDNSSKWQEHPKVAKTCKFENKDDGAFWMCYEDFLKYWTGVGIVDRTVDVHTLQIDIEDEGAACGPTTACLYGCGKFWCCCQGCRRLYCAHRSSQETAKLGFCSCCYT